MWPGPHVYFHITATNVTRFRYPVMRCRELRVRPIIGYCWRIACAPMGMACSQAMDATFYGWAQPRCKFSGYMGGAHT